MSPRTLEGVPLTEEERAAARHMLTQAYEMRCASAAALRAQLTVEERAAERITEELNELVDRVWGALPADVRKLRSDILRRELYAGGREVFPVRTAFGNPVRCG